MTRYAERLAAPVRWWVLAALAVLALATIAAALPVWLAVVGLAAAAVGLLVGLLAVRLEIRVDDAGLTVGRARLPWSAIGPVTALDGVAAARLRGPGADPTAYLALRGWVPRAVRVEVVDDDDPTPYWYVSTRRPTELAAALRQRAAPPPGPTAPT